MECCVRRSRVLTLQLGSCWQRSNHQTQGLLFASTVLPETAICRRGASFCSDMRQQEFNSINLFLMRAELQHSDEDFCPKNSLCLEMIFSSIPASLCRASTASRSMAQHEAVRSTPLHTRHNGVPPAQTHTHTQVSK